MPKQTGTGIVERRQAAAKAIESAFPGYQAKTEAVEAIAEAHWAILDQDDRDDAIARVLTEMDPPPGVVKAAQMSRMAQAHDDLLRRLIIAHVGGTKTEAAGTA